MVGTDGLAPLVGVRGASGDVFAASNLLGDGTTLDALPNETAYLNFVAPESGELVLVATRAGGQNGPTTGGYRLTLRLLSPAPEPTDVYPDVTFRCGAEIATSLAYVQFGDTRELGDRWTLTVWATFPPAIRLGDGLGARGCVRPDTAETSALPALTAHRLDWGEQVLDAPDGLTFEYVVQYVITPSELPSGVVGLMIASLDGVPDGVFVARVEGLGLESGGDSDVITLQHGALVKDRPLRLLFQREDASRLDVQVMSERQGGIVTCDDWGLRTCALNGWRAADMAYNNRRVAFDVLDAAAEMLTSDVAPAAFRVYAGNPNVSGTYTFWLVGGVAENLP
jgi:hypothetical protein